MRKVQIAERLMGERMGAQRGAAIYGDLEEMASTRGRLWFWAAYLRVMAPLWLRTGITGFVVAIAVMRLTYATLLLWWWNWWQPRNFPHPDHALFGMQPHQWRAVIWDLPSVVAEICWYAVPFLLLRFGWRDRLTRLACVLLLAALPVYGNELRLAQLSAALVAGVLVSGFILPRWRRETAIVVLSFLATALSAWPIAVLWQRWFYPPQLHQLTALPWHLVARMVLPGFRAWPAFAVGAAILLRFRRQGGCETTPPSPAPNSLTAACSKGSTSSGAQPPTDRLEDRVPHVRPEQSDERPWGYTLGGTHV
jgi:hypothetical protein